MKKQTPRPVPVSEQPPHVWTRQEYGQLLLATVGIAFAFVRLLVPPFLKMPLLVVPVALLLLWAAWRLTKPRVLITTPLGWPLLLFSLATVISSFLGIGPGNQIVAVLLFWGGMMGIPLFLAAEMLAWGWHPRILTNAVLITITILLIYAVGETLLFWAEWWLQRQPGETLLPPFHEQNYVAMAHPNAVTPFTIGIPLVVAAMWQARARWFQVVGGIWLFWAVIVIFYTSARVGWVSMTVSMGTMMAFLLWHAYRTRSQFRRAVGAVVLSVCYAALFLALFIGNYVPTMLAPPPEQSAAPTEPQETATPPGETGMPDTPDTPDESLEETVEETFEHLSNPMGRWVFWKRAIQIFAEHPVFGAGPWGYTTRYREIEPSSKNFLPEHTHNTYLAVLSELGSVGMVGFVWLCVVGVGIWWRGLRACTPWTENWWLVVACGTIGVAIAVDCVFSVSPPQNGLLVLAALMAGLAVGNGWGLSPAPGAGQRATHRATLSSDTPDTPWFSIARFRDAAHMPHPLHAVLVVCCLLAWGVATLVMLWG